MVLTDARILTRVLRKLRTPALTSSALVLPFLVFESVNRRGFREGFPVALFGFLWLLTFTFVLLLPIVRSLSARTRYGVPRLLIPRAVLLIFIAWLWISVTADQLPCFLGVPNCD